MQVLVSTSFATTGALRIPVEGAAVAEMLRISSVFVAMASSLHLLQLHKEAFVFRRERVGIEDGRSHDVGHRALLLAAADESPVNGESDLVHGFVRHFHGLD